MTDLISPADLTWSVDLTDLLISWSGWSADFLKNWFFWNFDFFDFLLLKFCNFMLLYYQSRSIVNGSFRQMLDYPEPKYNLLIFHINILKCYPTLLPKPKYCQLIFQTNASLAWAEVLSTGLSDKYMIGLRQSRIIWSFR